MVEIESVVVPKWGLSMEEGMLIEWHVNEGDEISVGDELLDIETSKITNTLESQCSGTLRRKLGQLDESYLCGSLLAVIADASISDAEIDAFIDSFSIETVKPDAANDLDSVAEPVVMELGNKQIRYLQQGRGDIPLIFIHGFGGDLDNWLFVQPALSEEHTTYTLDLPGHGGSSKDIHDLNSLKDLADLILEFIQAMNIPRAHIVAHSMGGGISLQLAKHHPEVLASLTLIAPTGLNSPVDRDFIEGVIESASRRQLTRVLKRLFYNESLVTRDLAENFAKYKRLDGVEEALNSMARFMATETINAMEILSEFKLPVNLIWGREDRVVPLISGQQLPANVTLDVLEETGHMPHMERATKVVELIQRLVSA